MLRVYGMSPARCYIHYQRSPDCVMSRQRYVGFLHLGCMFETFDIIEVQPIDFAWAC